jgi:hypothetical protein
MDVPFTLSKRTRVRVVVSSWTTYPNATAWILWKMQIVHAGSS